MLYFEWSPPWHFKAFRALAQSLSYKSHSKTQHCFIWSKVFCGRGAQLTLQLISFHLAPVVGSSFLILISSSHACCIMLNSYQVSLGWNAVAKQHQQESNLMNSISYDILSGICIWHIFWHSFWQSIWYIFGDSLWLMSGGQHSDLVLAVEVRRGTLWSGACGGGPAGNTLIGCCSGPAGNTGSRACSWGPAITLIHTLLFGSGREYCDLELAVVVRWRKEEEEGGGPADI